MPQRRIGMRIIKEIIRLSRECDLSQRKIALAVRKSRPKVAQVINALEKMSYSEIKLLPDSELETICYKKLSNTLDNKYSKLFTQFPYFSKELTKPGVRLKLLWEEYKVNNANGYEYSQFCLHYQKWKESLKVSMHMEYRAGELMFCDYAGKKLQVTNRETGEIRPVPVFVSILPATSKTFAIATESEKTKEWIYGCQESFQYFGGVTKGVVPDNAKPVITKVDRYSPDVNPQFQSFAEHYNTVISPARVRKPRDKALVESAVSLIYQRVFAPLRNTVFYSLRELNTAIRELVIAHNNKLMKGYQASRSELFENIEKSLLIPLPQYNYKYREAERNRTVQFNYHVLLRTDNHYYSVPWILKGQKCHIFYDSYTVEIFHKGKRVATHLREYGQNRYTTKINHMPKAHREYSQWTPQRFISWASSIGEATMNITKEILKRQRIVQQGYRTCMGLLNLQRKYGQERLENACLRACSYRSYSYQTVKNILVNGYDKKVSNSQCLFFDIPENENIRGSNYYK